MVPMIFAVQIEGYFFYSTFVRLAIEFNLFEVEEREDDCYVEMKMHGGGNIIHLLYV
jgi:hypothetical protein